MIRKLSLAKETLAELTDPQLANVIAAANASGPTCPLVGCLDTGDDCVILLPTRRGCTPAFPE